MKSTGTSQFFFSNKLYLEHYYNFYNNDIDIYITFYIDYIIFFYYDSYYILTLEFFGEQFFKLHNFFQVYKT